ncbi:nuclear transport factor 2 family protein [Sphingomonas profundi]|uniref:nuclear transport factor 2 family protein n=1 Tax=Alterirhizorhabdus profundi TaxID=2681549 RepID=UPI0012E91BFA|nr:nuclear transport factor 2 family protein [Sphingomonas profundi]
MATVLADDWAADFFRDADSFDLPTLVGWFADDVEVRFGNAPAIVGKAAAEEAFRGFWSSISGMRHGRECLVVDGAMAAQFSQVTYKRHDGSEVTMPVASQLRRVGEGRIDRLWIVIDMAPLFQVAI